MDMANEIPVTILGGYLGAGKTTLLNGVLSDPHGLRVAVIVNDFGPISIDEKLIKAAYDDLITLANGCACCTIAGDLGIALDRLAAQQIRPDHILVETSGVSDPRQVAKLSQAPGLRPHATIVMADADSVKSLARDKFVGRLVRRQLSGADIIVVNKTDLVGHDRLIELSNWLESLAPQIPHFHASFGRVPASLMFDVPVKAARSGYDENEPFDRHPNFHTFHWGTKYPVDIQRLQQCLAKLPATVVRAKGIVGSVPETDARFAVHRVGQRISVSPMLSGIATRRTDIVILSVGCPLDVQALADAFQACIARHSSIQ
jgi:G3E family GTPase